MITGKPFSRCTGNEFENDIDVNKLLEKSTTELMQLIIMGRLCPTTV